MRPAQATEASRERAHTGNSLDSVISLEEIGATAILVEVLGNRIDELAALHETIKLEIFSLSTIRIEQLAADERKLGDA